VKPGRNFGKRRRRKGLRFRWEGQAAVPAGRIDFGSAWTKFWEEEEAREEQARVKAK